MTSDFNSRVATNWVHCKRSKNLTFCVAIIAILLDVTNTDVFIDYSIYTVIYVSLKLRV